MSTYIIVASMSTHMSSRIAGHTLFATVTAYGELCRFDIQTMMVM